VKWVALNGPITPRLAKRPIWAHACVALPGEVLICPHTYELVRGQIEATPMNDLQFKGISRNLTVYRVDRILV
jgi:class 3 adenylate cyclase